MEEKKFLSAKEARELSDKSPILLKRLGKFIKESAEEGMTSCYFSVCNVSSRKIEAIKAELEKKGYNVNLEDDLLIVEW